MLCSLRLQLGNEGESVLHCVPSRPGPVLLTVTISSHTQLDHANEREEKPSSQCPSLQPEAMVGLLRW